MSAGAYAGIGLGVGLAILIGVSILLSWKKKWFFFRKKTSDTQIKFEKEELHGEAIPRVEVMEKERAELEDKSLIEVMEWEVAELQTVESSHEASGTVIAGHDMMHEMDANEMIRSRSEDMDH